MAIVPIIKHLPQNVVLHKENNLLHDQTWFTVEFFYMDKKWSLRRAVTNQALYTAYNPEEMFLEVLKCLVYDVFGMMNWDVTTENYFVKKFAYALADNKVAPYILEIKSKKPANEAKGGYTLTETNGQLINPAVAVMSDASTLSRSLPGVQSFVEYPCDCYPPFEHRSATLWNIIQHLNDDDDWSREKIADWIDELHDKKIINAEFAPWNDDPLAPEEEELKQEPVVYGGDFNVGAINAGSLSSEKIGDKTFTAEQIKAMYEDASVLDGWKEVGVFSDKKENGVLDGWVQVGYTVDGVEFKAQVPKDLFTELSDGTYSIGPISLPKEETNEQD